MEKFKVRIRNLPAGEKVKCAECIHAEKQGYCEDVNCSQLWRGASCSCHINPSCGICLNNKFEQINQG